MAESTCSVADCGRAVQCKSLCDPHYRRLLKYGDPLADVPIRQRINGSPAERFWARVDKNGPVPSHLPELGSCWVWTGRARSANGYPQIRHGDRMQPVHRFAHELLIGPIPDGLQVDHACHNQSGCPGGPECPHRRCVNPDHLDAVTNDENQARRAGMHYAEMCRAGLHEMSDSNVRVTLTGMRVCRTCTPDQRPDFEGVCANGHPRTPENVVLYGTNRQCRRCRADAQRRYRTKSA